MAEEVQHRTNVLNCELTKSAHAAMLDIKLKLDYLILLKKNLDEKGCCMVDLSSTCSESSLLGMIDQSVELMNTFKSSLLEHGQKHPAQSGRKVTDSGYCQSGEISDTSRLSGMAERFDYPLENLDLLSIVPQTDAKDVNSNTSKC